MISKKSNKALTIFFTIISLLSFYFFNRIAFIAKNHNEDLIKNIIYAIDSVFREIYQTPIFLSFTKSSLLTGFCGFISVWLIYLYNLFSSKNYKPGEEHGSSVWGNTKDSKPFANKDSDQNIILSNSEFLNIKKASNFEFERNKNIIVIGGSGCGKTYSLIKPNLMQLHSSYVIPDPKGTLLPDTGHLMKSHGYEIRSFNTINFLKSLHYNPLAYVNSEKDILKLVNVIIENTKGEGEKSGEDFWVKSERLFFCALIGYLCEVAPLSERNIPTMIDMVELCEVREEDESFENPVDILFDELAEEKPDCFAVKQYRKYKLAAGKTAKSILISVAARLSPFDVKEVREIMQYDELQLDEIGDRKTAFYVIMSDTDNTFSFLIAMIFYQMFNLLCEKADDEYGGKLPFHVRCLLDEFANIGKIPNFEKLISTIRSREISAMIVLQSLAQLEPIYGKKSDVIVDCCDTLIFLGGKSTQTTETVSKMIGKTTIDNRNVNETKGESGSFSLQYQILGRDLIDPSEIGRLNRNECIVVISGVNPFRSRKFQTEKHKRFSYLADADKANLFDITVMNEPNVEEFLSDVKEVEEVTIDLSELNDL